MKINLKTFWVIFVSLFFIDQFIKYGFVYLDFGFESSCISLVLAYNYGVAFSMFAFLQEYLKYIQLLIIAGVVVYLYFNKKTFYDYSLPVAILLVGGLSNILDRFTYGAVVDYVYWHCGFEFAIFNLADVLINIAVAMILFKQYQDYRKDKEKNLKAN